VPLPDHERLRHSEAVDSRPGNEIPRNAVRGAVIGSLTAAVGLFLVDRRTRNDLVGAAIAGGGGNGMAVFPLGEDSRPTTVEVADDRASNDPS